MMQNNGIIKSISFIDEPFISFGYGQKVFDPRDGLMLFGPYTRTKLNDINIGIIGTDDGIKRLMNYLLNIRKPIKNASDDIARPIYPGFENVFGVKINYNSIKSISLQRNKIYELLKYKDSHQRVYRLVDLYTNELVKYKKQEEQDVQVWFVVIPDEVYLYCRPKSVIPTSSDNIDTGIKSKESIYMPFLFPELEDLRKAYFYEVNFHNQLKARLLAYQIITQIVRESTVAFREILNISGKPKRDLSMFESAIAWGISTALYYKVGGLPWKLSEVRDGVCYVGLVFKKIETEIDHRTACCAAQMFLDSGDGLVFRGNIGPWYNPDKNEYHLSEDGANSLLSKAIESYYEKHNKYPKQMFIHGKTYFDDREWRGFTEAAKNKTVVIGIRIRDDRVFKLYRDYSYPILRGMYYPQNNKKAYLWTRGFVPRLQTQIGLETPNPLSIEINRGEENIEIVCKDVLSLTKLNYNTCIYGDGLPVTLRFADSIGEVLSAGPERDYQVLPFKHYI